MGNEKKDPEPEPGGQGSEVARLRKQITDEYEAAHRGLTGLSYGTSKHEFITARMENMEKARRELEKLVGPNEAIRILAEQMDKAGKHRPEEPEEK